MEDNIKKFINNLLERFKPFEYKLHSTNKNGLEDWYSEEFVSIAMREYAEMYARKCLEIAASQVEIGPGNEQHPGVVDTDTIVNIKLPSHD